MLRLIACILFIVVMLTACNNETEDEANENQATSQKQHEKEEKDETTNSDGEKNTKVEDQLDLKIGDTGTFDTTIGTYEMTLHTAELKGAELDGVTSQLDAFILLNIAIHNTSQKDLSIEDIIMSMEVTDNLEQTGSLDGAGAFESIEEFTGVIKPGEEKTGQFIAEVFEADKYYFREDPGNVAAGGSNQVIWNIPISEVE